MDGYTVLKVGQVYGHTNGDSYECIEFKSAYDYVMERIADHWTCEVHGVKMTDDNLIHWDYSTGGPWKKEKYKVESYIYDDLHGEFIISPVTGKEAGCSESYKAYDYYVDVFDTYDEALTFYNDCVRENNDARIKGEDSKEI